MAPISARHAFKHLWSIFSWQKKLLVLPFAKQMVKDEEFAAQNVVRYVEPKKCCNGAPFIHKQHMDQKAKTLKYGLALSLSFSMLTHMASFK